MVVHDESGMSHTIVFKNNGNDSLPTLLYALYEKTDLFAPPIKEQMAVYSKVLIDEWNDSLYCGTFSFFEHSWVFWAKH